ncbi:Inner membrane transport protein ynfM [Pantoea agglomerans]|uniref:Inner membrane transport protein ynfM n=1 Tax=Enterobacter agglomerans TaxID=549 RepID=A0A379AGQ6_ENTAG|nr:Inner membrane transport protein ynfM [Pantoea agglomerans]
MLLGLLITAFNSLWLILPGMMLFTAGFFAAHAVASGWIGPRARRAREARPLRSICSATTWVPASRVRWVACSGIISAGIGITLFISVLLMLALLVAWASAQ